MAMITDIEDFFARGCGRCDRFDTADCSTKHWADGLAKLRRICLDLALEEHVKWGHPVYMYAGRNIAIIGAQRGNFSLGFFNAALLQDPEGALVKNGPNTKHASLLSYTGIVGNEETVRVYLQEAMNYAEQGIKPPKEAHELDLPEELVEALDADPELAEAFHALTPGRKRGYEIVIGGAKKSETRINRIIKLRPKILAGKGANEY